MGAEHPSPTRPSYYTHGALKTRGGCRASIAHVWSPKNRGMGAEPPLPTHGAVAWTRQPPHIFFLFLDKSRNLSKIVSVLRYASVERFDVSRMRDFLLNILVTHVFIQYLSDRLLMNIPLGTF